MIAANAELVLSNRAVTASQESLNRATSVIGIMRSGAYGLVVFGWRYPRYADAGCRVAGTAYQYQEQARQSAQDYARQIDQIRDKTSKMSR
jgi:hypothetical protein